MSERRRSAETTPETNPENGRVFDAGERPMAEAVIEATAMATGRDPLDMEPLFDAIDPDALESIVARPNNGTGVTVSFEFEGRQVTVQRGGRIHIADG